MAFIKTGVIGHPVSHSKSPFIHNTWIKQYNLQGSYEALDIKPEDLTTELPRLLREEGYTGFNITVPHKERALNICDEIDGIAQNIGAVNTITMKEGKIHGTNTDAFGFIENIKTADPDFDFTSGPAIVLGAGGASRAILYGLVKEGCQDIILTNRTKEKAEALAGIFPHITIIDWEERHTALEQSHLLVNTTTLGMEGQPPLDINLEHFPQEALVTDIVYTPLQTDLLKSAQSRGNPVLTGIGMLLHQARPGFALWHGVMPDVDPTLESQVLAL